MAPPRVEVVHVGSACRDIAPDDPRGWRLGGGVINLFDKVYLQADGSGVGAGQPVWGQRRGFFVGLRKSF